MQDLHKSSIIHHSISTTTVLQSKRRKLLKLFNPLSPNVADLKHFNIVLFCGFSLCNAFRPSTELFTGSLGSPISRSSKKGGLRSRTPEKAAVKTETVRKR